MPEDNGVKCVAHEHMRGAVIGMLVARRGNDDQCRREAPR